MIIIHLTYLVILLSVYYLPLVTIQYNMHTIMPEHASVGVPARQRPRQPIQIQSTQLALDVMIYGVCGRQSRKTLLKIHENMEILRSAGNRPTNHGNDKGIQEIFIYENRLQSLLDTVLARTVNEIICHVANNDNEQGSMSPQPSFDRQYATWVAAGLVVLMILLFAAPLSLFCIVLICTLNWIEWRYKHRRSTRSKSRWWLVIELLSNVNTGLVLFATFLYVALTWQECRSSKASYGSGYIIMLLASIFMSIRLSGLLIEDMLAATRCSRKFSTMRGK